MLRASLARRSGDGVTKRFLCGTLAALAVLAFTRVNALTQKQIDTAIAKAKMAGAMPAPYEMLAAFEVNSSLENALQVGDADYEFYAQTCRAWIPYQVWLARTNFTRIDREGIAARCLREERIDLMVAREDRRPLTDREQVILVLDGEMQDLKGTLKDGRWLATESAIRLMAVKRIEFIVSVDGAKAIRVEADPAKLRRMLGW